jgi:small-conductance mechanosensitive channel
MGNMSLIEKKEKKTAGNNYNLKVLISICFWSFIIAVVVAIVWGYFFSFGDFWMDDGYCIDCTMGSFIHCEPMVKGWNQNYPIIEAYERYNNLKCFLFLETSFYFLPFLMVSLCACFIKEKKLKNTLAIFCGIIIFCLQLLLGYLSYKVEAYGSVSDHVLLIGGLGIITAITYGYVLFHSYRHLVNGQNKSKLKALFFAHLFALVSSGFVLFFVFFSHIVVTVFLVVILVVIYYVFILVYLVYKLVGTIVKRIRQKGRI